MFAKRVGLTPRTVRSYHARGILPPPVRISRTPYYTEAHLARMHSVVQMQRGGLPLEAIRALLNPDRVLGEFVVPAKQIAATVHAEPSLRHALTSSGVLYRQPDGALTVVSMRAVASARSALPAEAPLSETLKLLASTVTAVRPLAEAALTLVRGAAQRHIARYGSRAADLTDLTAEAVRLSLLASATDRMSLT
ncbi:MerR family transcriptional regulator [Allorhizocola rhizosphaerae]|uniref:MerR family transcriptional regulator n=1 Tax=Allorhizocola rhizosphaerae TaxID=1872709 RepID=UPI0013C2B675|nr:MerR family transcriptional regulator [Allorhizocola rhizosphaerae]